MINGKQPNHLCLLLNETRQYVHQHDENEHQPLHIPWHDHQSEEDLIDMKAAIPIKHEIPASKRVKIYDSPEFQLAASLVHPYDPYDTNYSATAKFAPWITN